MYINVCYLNKACSYSPQLISSLMSEQSGLLSQTKLRAIHSPVLQLNSSVEQGAGGPWTTNKQ